MKAPRSQTGLCAGVADIALESVWKPDHCQGQLSIPQNDQLEIPQLKPSDAGLALPVHLGQLREDAGFALLPQPVTLTPDVDGC